MEDSDSTFIGRIVGRSDNVYLGGYPGTPRTSEGMG